MDLFINSTTFKKYGIQQLDVFEPCRAEQFLSRDYWRCLVQERTMPGYHPTSTCRMGPNSSVAVVDSKLKSVSHSLSLKVFNGYHLSTLVQI